MSETSVVAIEHSMTRLDVNTRIPFDDFVAAFEKAAPAFDPAPFAQVVAEGHGWDGVVSAMREFAPHALVVYARIDTRPLVAVAGLDVRAIEYLLGNHVIATSMLRHDPHALLYAPLRVLVFSDATGDAIFAIDRPSTVFAGLNDPDIAETGLLLDQKVSGLLRAIGVDIGFESGLS